MIQQTNSPIWRELIDEGEFSVPVKNAKSEEPHGPTVNLHGEDVSLSLALDELASAMKTLEMASEAVKELQAAIAPTIIELGGAEDARIITKVTKGRQVTEHGTVTWKKVSEALNVPKSILGRHTPPPTSPTVSFKLKEATK